MNGVANYRRPSPDPTATGINQTQCGVRTYITQSVVCGADQVPTYLLKNCPTLTNFRFFSILCSLSQVSKKSYMVFEGFESNDLAVLGLLLTCESSVTRFGKISPLWQKIKSFWQFVGGSK